MNDLSSFDFAFVFKYPVGNNNLVAVWTHQAVLAAKGKLKRVYRIPDMDSVSPLPPRLRVFTSKYALVPYCVLIRYLSTGQVHLEVDLHDFVVTPMPIQSPDQYDGSDPIVNEILSKPVRLASWSDLHQLAVEYGLKDLQALCADRK
ncbi:hypothetical protein BG005_002755 [Podila minutissima]|nr:hypothetical protein BG005_002755 [Podila minutissima]